MIIKVKEPLKKEYLLIKEGIEAKVIEIPNKLDPDEWVKKEKDWFKFE